MKNCSASILILTVVLAYGAGRLLAQAPAGFAPQPAAGAKKIVNFYDSQSNGNDFHGIKALPAIGFTDVHGGVASFSAGNLVLTPEPAGDGSKVLLRDVVLRGAANEQAHDMGCRVVLPANYRTGNAMIGLLLRFRNNGSGLVLNFTPDAADALTVYSCAEGALTQRGATRLSSPYDASHAIAVEGRVVADAAVALTVTDLANSRILGFLNVPLDFGLLPAGGFGLATWMTAPGHGTIIVSSVQTYPVTAVVCDGDSLTSGENDSIGKGTASPLATAYPGVVQKLIGNRYYVFNLGIGGLVVNQIANDAPKRVDALLAPAEQPPIIVMEGGTNDFGIDGSIKPPMTVEQAAQKVYERLQAFWKARHAARPDTIVVDVTNTPAAHPVYIRNLGSKTGFNERRDALNALRKKPPTPVDVRPDWLVDLTTDPHIGQDGNEQDATYFAARDQTHLTGAGYAIVGAAVAAVIQKIGTTVSAPPAVPGGLFAQPVAGGAFDLFWNYGVDSKLGYQIFASLDPNRFPAAPAATAPAYATYFPVTGLEPNRAYRFAVRALNAAGASGFATTAAGASGPAPTVNFTGGFGSAAAVLTANGFGGSPPLAGSVLRLTDGGTDETRSVWLNTAQNIARFSTEFAFQTSKASGDGFTFAMQRVGLTALGGTGGNLGYEGIRNSAAIKFDLYPNASTTGLYRNGAPPGDSTAPTSNSSGSISVVSAGLDFHSGNVFRVRLNYDGAVLTETITDLATRASFTQKYPVDLPAVLGGSTAFPGFTACDGGVTAQQEILSWSYTAAPPAGPK